MEALKCKMCGSTSVTKEGEFYVCAYCGTKYPEKMKIELGGEVKVQGIDNFETMLERGDTFLKLNEYDKAKKVFDKLADLYPNKCIVYIKQIIALTYNFTLTYNLDDDYSHILHNKMKSDVMLLEERFLALCSVEQTIQYGADLKKIKDYIAFLDYKEEQDELKKKMEKLEEEIKKCDNDIGQFNVMLNEANNELLRKREIMSKEKRKVISNIIFYAFKSIMIGLVFVFVTVAIFVFTNYYNSLVLVLVGILAMIDIVNITLHIFSKITSSDENPHSHVA